MQPEDAYSIAWRLIEGQLARIDAAAGETTLRAQAWQIVRQLLDGERPSEVLARMAYPDGQAERFAKGAEAATHIVEYLRLLRASDPSGADRLTAQVQEQLDPLAGV